MIYYKFAAKVLLFFDIAKFLTIKIDYASLFPKNRALPCPVLIPYTIRCTPHPILHPLCFVHCVQILFGHCALALARGAQYKVRARHQRQRQCRIAQREWFAWFIWVFFIFKSIVFSNAPRTT